MIKVLNIISDRNIGGAGRCLINFLKHYNRKLFLVKVVLPKGSLLKSEIQKLDVEVIELDGIEDKSFDIIAIGKLRSIIKSEKPNIVHTHSVLSARIAAKICGGVKIVYTRHSVFPVSSKISKGIGKIANKVINEFFADKIIAVAEAAKDNLTEGGISEKNIRVILNGVEPLTKASYKEISDTKSKYGIAETDFVVGILARLNEVKGHYYLIKAVAKIKRLKGNNIKFIIVGTGDTEKKLKEQVNLMNLNNNVIFTGFINDVSNILSIMDLQVNASFGTEATSLALLEGMSLGIPAVVTDYGGNPGVISSGQNGLIVKTKDSDDLANGILRIINDDGLRVYMQKKSIEIFNKKFTAQIYCKNIENIYKSLICTEHNRNITFSKS